MIEEVSIATFCDTAICSMGRGVLTEKAMMVAERRTSQ